MIEAHYNPITGQSFKIVEDTQQTVSGLVAQGAIEKIQKQKMTNLRKNNCKNK
ncbi:MAG: hypothetical protein J5611_00620 [Alphaproteobacteria bacterium]|nr:hypothetical protein [Alphaproteobacteria bacterium]